MLLCLPVLVYVTKINIILLYGLFNVTNLDSTAHIALILTTTVFSAYCTVHGITMINIHFLHTEYWKYSQL
jgi:hypothetical protein